MVDRAERDPTMEEIVVALRESRRDAVRAPPFTVVGNRPDGPWDSPIAGRGSEIQTARPYDRSPPPQDDTAPLNVTDLRDAEIERLLGENARLNERIVFLLKVIEREQRRNLALSGGAVVEIHREAVTHEVKAALEAELRPVLMVLLRLLEARQADAATPVAATAPAMKISRHGRSDAPDGPGGGVPLLDRRRDR